MNRMTQNMKKVMSMMLAVAMMLTLNLADLTVHAAAAEIAKPETETVVANPGNVTRATIGNVGARFYKDNNGDQIYLRRTYASSTELASLKSVRVVINTSDTVTSNDVTVTQSPTNQWSFTADLANKAPEIKIGDVSCIVAAGIAAGSSTPTADGYVTGVKINGKDASVTRTVVNNPCPGNLYYTEGTEEKIDWISITNYITASSVPAPSNLTQVPLAYSIIGGATGSASVDLSSGSGSVTIGSFKYTVQAGFAAATGFRAIPTSFRVNFQELRSYVKGLSDPGKYADQIKMAEQIETGWTAYYNAADTKKEFDEGTTNMQVLQTILQWCADNGYIDGSETTLGSNVTYVAEINGLGEFSVGSMSGWMYTDDPSNSNPTLWPTPAVGGADYVLSSNSTIVWFFTVDYGTHPW